MVFWTLTRIRSYKSYNFFGIFSTRQGPTIQRFWTKSLEPFFCNIVKTQKVQWQVPFAHARFFSKMLLPCPMSTSRLCTKFEVRSSFRLGCRVVTDRQTCRQIDYFSKTTFSDSGTFETCRKHKISISEFWKLVTPLQYFQYLICYLR